MQSTIIVEGMTCGHCANAVTQELLKISGVSDVTVEVESGVVLVQSESTLEQTLVAQAIEEAGYTLLEMK